jgi:tetratricopeptide (TPR) repeat protein
MLSIEDSHIACLNRPYIDLSPFDIGSFHLYGIEHCYQNLVSDAPVGNVPFPYSVQVNLPSSFRKSLIKETGLIQYQVHNPLELNNSLKTERWNKLCFYLRQYQDLDPFVQLRIINLLKSLSFHELVVEYVPEVSASEMNKNSALAGLALNRSMSNLMLQLDHNNQLDLDELECIAHHAPSQTQIKFSAALQLVVQYAKAFKDLPSAEFWCSVSTQELESLKDTIDPFTYNHLLSIYYRAVVFVPLLGNNKEEVIRQMDLSESYAETLLQKSQTDTQRIIAQENLNIVYESRTKESMWLGDIDMAEEKVKKLNLMDPLDPRYRLELGEIFLKQGKVEEAAKIYRSAARLGPPGTPIAWFMAGQCHEKLGDIDIACDCYLASVQMDELAISAVERLHYLAPQLGNSALANWSTARLQKLKQQQKQIASQPRTSYIPEASSGLKLAGEKALALS